MLLLIGLGYLAILPIFEGFDETASFSSLRQIADAKTIPVNGKSYLDKEITDYKGPVAYSSGLPPFDGGTVYTKFFEYSELVDSYSQTYRQPHPHSPYAPSKGLNWQAQHPPLYYLLLAPLEKATDHFSFVSQFFLLRLASYLLALAGVAFGLLAIKQSNKLGNMSPAIIGFILYPVILPMFFPEFARIGNDSLCLFLVGLISLLLSRLLHDGYNHRLSIAIGITLGLGLLTKDFFIPIIAAIVLFLLLRMQRYRSMRESWRIILTLSPPLLIGAVWYANRAKIGGGIEINDAIRLAHHGGLIVNLREHFSLFGLARGIAQTAVTWVWAGTWSLTRLPLIFYVPMLLLVFWVIGAYLVGLRRRPLSDLEWLPVWSFIFFGGGLFYHELISLALFGSGSTPGWYLHILMPWVAPAIGLGICSIWQYKPARYLLVGLLSYAVLFQMIALWAQFALFTGCATKAADKYYSFPGRTFCLVQTPQLVDRLAVLGWPVLAAIGFGGGIICALWLLAKMLGRQRTAVV
jgi:4-amino-4-deoxy-L-arabinose transferase-like glycosyltransferase